MEKKAAKNGGGSRGGNATKSYDKRKIPSTA